MTYNVEKCREMSKNYSKCRKITPKCQTNTTPLVSPKPGLALLRQLHVLLGR
jgi:hypothetical protein